MRDESNPKSRGGYSGTVTIRYYVDSKVSYFNFNDDPDFLTKHPEMLNEGIRNYYEVQYLVSYIPMEDCYTVYFNDTMQDITP